jgi:hypothetical protein
MYGKTPSAPWLPSIIPNWPDSLTHALPRPISGRLPSARANRRTSHRCTAKLASTQGILGHTSIVRIVFGCRANAHRVRISPICIYPAGYPARDGGNTQMRIAPTRSRDCLLDGSPCAARKMRGRSSHLAIRVRRPCEIDIGDLGPLGQGGQIHLNKVYAQMKGESIVGYSGKRRPNILE